MTLANVEPTAAVSLGIDGLWDIRNLRKLLVPGLICIYVICPKSFDYELDMQTHRARS